VIGGLSVLITARDEEAMLPGALASVAGLAAETVVVLDPRSTDGTCAVAAAAGVRVLEHAYASSAAQCNWGLDQCRHDWVFVLDADERVTAGLTDALAAAPANPVVSAFAVRRVNFAFGRRLRFGDWGRDWVVRLLDRRVARFDERAVHGEASAPSLARIGGELHHLTLRSLRQYLPKLHDYAGRGADELVANGRRATPCRALVHASWRFVRAFVLRLGFLDRGAGLVVAGLAAYGTFLKWVLAWDGATRPPSRP
jgi:(heptosyl)LPS beta-1,4-glucosyltransferase